MKIIAIEPLRFSASGTGLVDVVYYKRHGYLWLDKKLVRRRAMSRTGILWKWVDSPEKYLFKVSDIIKGNVPELCKGETLHINDGEKA